MKQMWSPWRSQYIETFKDKDKKNQCFICEAIANQDLEKDKELLVVKRSKFCIAILNKFPYNSGHILVAPLRHISVFEELQPEELADIMNLVQKAIAIQKQLFSPHGFNIGVNIGVAAGAGLPSHIHFHIVPRWNGDSNFTAVFADMKVISADLKKMQEEVSELFETI
jgi:ATP adenylyltransferase